MACMREAVATTLGDHRLPPSRDRAEVDQRLPGGDAHAEGRQLGQRPRLSTRCASSPARTARSASSSVATGAPKTAMTASPMYFSITPPYWRITSRSAAKYSRCRMRICSGSASSEKDVNPAMSMKRTVMRRRSSFLTELGAVSTREPHAVQKAASAEMDCPQWTHSRVRRVPQPPQNLSSGPATRAHLEQVGVLTSPPARAEG
jgi:hypothetical protein